jgi:hypothetical protein
MEVSSPKCLEDEGESLEIRPEYQGKNGTGAIHSRLTSAMAKHTKKKVASKVRYDS